MAPVDSPLSNRLMGRHREPGDPSRAGVSPGVIVRYRGPGKHERARLGPAVHLAANVVPHAGGFELTLVDQLGRRPVEYQVGSTRSASRVA